MNMISKNLKKIRESKGLNPRQLSKLCNVSHEWIYKVENGDIKNIGIEKLEDVAKGLDITIFDLIGSEYVDNRLKRPPQAFEAPIIISQDIPVVGLARAGRGGFYDEQGHPVDDWNQKLPRPNILKSKWAYGVKIEGDSMSPKFKNGQRVYIDPDEEITKGCFAIVRLKTGEVMAKQIDFDQDKKLIVLTSINQSHPPIVQKEKDIDFMHRITLAEV